MAGDYPSLTKERVKLLDNIRVVLVEAKFPGNLGMAARAMKNTRLSDLRLVSPRAELNKEAYKMAVSAGDMPWVGSSSISTRGSSAMHTAISTRR